MARILIAEHNESTSSYLAAALKKAGNNVLQAGNCLEAWRASTKESFDILLVDVVMPGIDGFVLAQKALQDNPHLQIIFITGFAGVAMDTQATPAYAPAPITTRPFHLREIASQVRYLMGLGSLPTRSIANSSADNVVAFPDFAQRTASSQQHVSS